MASGLQNIETVESPFRKFVTTIGVFPTAFTDAMTYYECLAYLVKYIEETLIPAINENAEAVEELQTLYIQLKSFVDNYFDNLDVQEEINNKLDAMVEDGTLQEIVGDYLNASALWCFDTVSDMVSSTNLIAGSYAKTLGFNSLNDHGGAVYKIRQVTNNDTEDGCTIIPMSDDQLVAELIKLPMMNIHQFGVTSLNSSNFQIALTYMEGGILDLDHTTITLNSTVNIPDSITICNGKIEFNSDLIYLLQNTSETVEKITIKNVEFKKKDNSFNNLNRFIYVTSGELDVIGCKFDNYATAIHHLGKMLIAKDNYFTNVYGTLAQYGYGIDTSSDEDVIENNTFINEDNTQGRHCVYLNGSKKVRSFVNNTSVKNWHHNPFMIKIENTNKSYTNINNTKLINTTIEAPGSNPLNTVGNIHVDENSSNSYINIDNITIDGTLRSAISCVSDHSIVMNINNVYAKFSTSSVNTNYHAMFLRYGKFYISNVTLDYLDTDLLNKGILIRQSTGSILNNIFSVNNISNDFIYVWDSSIQLGILSDETVATNGTSTITAMKLYS